MAGLRVVVEDETVTGVAEGMAGDNLRGAVGLAVLVLMGRKRRLMRTSRGYRWDPK